MKTIAITFARGGSKSIPGKNVKSLCGKPLIQHSLEMALAIDRISSVYVSTDDLQIADVARKLGCKVIERPTKLADDDTPEWLAWQHAVEELLKNEGSFDLLLSLPATSPLRAREDIHAVLDLAKKSDTAVVTVTETNHSPAFNMVSMNEEGKISLLDVSGEAKNRQEAPKCYNLATVAYAASPAYIREHAGILEGDVRAVLIPRRRAVDIDDEFDFRLASFLMSEQVASDGS